MILDVYDKWTCLSYRAGDKSDELIVEIRKTPSWWGRTWRKEQEVVTKVAFVGKAFEWLRPPSYEPIEDVTTKYKLYDLWFEAKRRPFLVD